MGASPFALSFFKRSRMMPNQSRLAHTASRMREEFSPIPPVKTMASALLDGAQRAAAPQVTRDDLGVRIAKQLRSSARDVAVTRPVKAPALNPVLRGPLQRDGVETLGGGDRLVKARLERGNERNLRQ